VLRRSIFRRRGRLVDNFVPVHFEVEETVERMETDVAAVLADERDDRERSSAADRKGHVAVCLDSRPFAVVPAGGTLTKRTATREEILKLPSVQAAEPITLRTAR
jgi:hypothetical protein